MKDNIKMDTSEMWHENVGWIYRRICYIRLVVFLYEGWNFNSGNYLFTTDTK